MKAMSQEVAHSGLCRENACDCGTFFLDCAGCFDRSQLILSSSSAPRHTNPQVDEIIEQTWRNETQRAGAAGRMLFNGKLCRLNSAIYKNSTLKLELGEVTFKEFLGTNLTHAYLRYTHGPEVLADALGTSAVIRTGDGFLLLGKRSKSVLYHAGRIHPVGGIVEACKDEGESKNAPPDPFESIAMEISQEININEYTDVKCLGLVRDKHIIQPELVFDIAIKPDFAQVRRFASTASDAQEHAELIPVRDHPASAVTFIEQNFCELTPVAMASLLLHGLRHWGSGWFAATRGYLRSVI